MKPLCCCTSQHQDYNLKYCIAFIVPRNVQKNVENLLLSVLNIVFYENETSKTSQAAACIVPNLIRFCFSYKL